MEFKALQLPSGYYLRIPEDACPKTILGLIGCVVYTGSTHWSGQTTDVKLVLDNQITLVSLEYEEPSPELLNIKELIDENNLLIRKLAKSEDKLTSKKASSSTVLVSGE